MRPRQPRNKRRAGIRVGLGERDEAVLAALARFGIARTKDLVRLVFSGVRRDTASKRLRRLFDGGFLEAETRGQAEDSLYRLGPQGRLWTAAQEISVCRAPRAPFDHHLAIVRTWVGMARACHEISGLSLVQFRPDWELRGTPEAAGMGVVPDALVEVGVLAGESSIHLALEVDLATERAATLRKKLVEYRRVLASGRDLWGGRDFGLALVLGGWSTSRKARLAEFVEGVWPGWWLSWDLGDGPEQSLRELAAAVGPPLTSSPYRKGRNGAVTDGFSVGSLPQGQGLSHEE